jgi:C1A family cysteine protease
MAKAKSVAPHAHRILNLVPSRNTEKDWRLEHAIASSAIAAPARKLPASVDLRESWWNVGDQESTGSCVGWSSTDGVARYHFVKAKKLAKTARLSPRFTWMASKETDEFTSRAETFIEGAGTSLKAAVEILRKYGSAPESLLPFHISTNLYLGDEETFYATTAKLRIASYFNLGQDVAKWRTWLATHGPILSGLHVDETWNNATATNGKLDTYKAKTAGGGHAIAIVGYTADKRFIVRNSWGTSWGDKGFAYASEAYIAAGFFKESYGITL